MYKSGREIAFRGPSLTSRGSGNSPSSQVATPAQTPPPQRNSHTLNPNERPLHRTSRVSETKRYPPYFVPFSAVVPKNPNHPHRPLPLPIRLLHLKLRQNRPLSNPLYQLSHYWYLASSICAPLASSLSLIFDGPGGPDPVFAYSTMLYPYVVENNLYSAAPSFQHQQQRIRESAFLGSGLILAK